MREFGTLLLGAMLAAVLTGCREQGTAPRVAPTAPPGEHWSRDADFARSLYTLSTLISLATDPQDAAARESLEPPGLWRTDHDHLTARYPIRAKVPLATRAGGDPGLPADARAFFLAHIHYATEYAREVLEKLGPPPDFELRRDLYFAEEDADLAAAGRELSGLMQRAWRLIEPDWAAVQPLWDSCQLPADRVQNLLEQTLAYLGDTGPAFDFGVLVYPTLRESNGIGTVLPGDRYLLLVGPTPDLVAEQVLIVHEFMHHPVERAARDRKVAAALRSSACAFESVTVNAGYVTWPSYFFETFIRAASPRVLGVDDPFFPFTHHEAINARLAQLEGRPDRNTAGMLINVLAVLEAGCKGE